MCRIMSEARAQMSRAYNAAHLGVLVIDGQHVLLDAQGVARRELTLATKIISEGRPLIVVINKLDVLSDAGRVKVRRCCLCCRTAERTERAEHDVEGCNLKFTIQSCQMCGDGLSISARHACLLHDMLAGLVTCLSRLPGVF